MESASQLYQPIDNKELFRSCRKDPKFPGISLGMLRNDKNYRKLVKKQAKDLELLRRRHEKEASTMLRAHTILTDKLNAAHAKASAGQKAAAQKYVVFY
ncbi:unnamed protein product [Dibothriocephalus latus]|uniref:Uncharacterized protein n=1 Tax=Dibothriocephalus latus TaxID=60516 RepID=A0A3P7N4X9_DIBLA|nr:unnamed protein product [Dibothriocephalus latus]